MKKQFYKVKQLADQTFSRSGKSESLTDELQAADRKVEHMRTALQLICKRLDVNKPQGQDQASRDKRMKKLPEYLLGTSMCEASTYDDEDSILKTVLFECGKAEKCLAKEIAEHELKVEQIVYNPLNVLNEQELPLVMKTKKQLIRLMSERDSASNRYNSLCRQIDQNPSKVNAAKEELEDATIRVEQCRDTLAAEMFSMVAKETQLAHTFLQYVKLQRAYHESALHSLHEVLPELERFINERALKPMFGLSLEDHLKLTCRNIAFPVELCVCTLSMLALNEEGLFRIAGGSSKIRRMKLSLDAGLFGVPLPPEYKDPHVVSSILKLYLRELPEPLLTRKLHSAFMTAARMPQTARLQAITDTVSRLPTHNYNNLRYLISFLATLTRNQATNKMTPANLAIVLAPNLLWSTDDPYDMATAACANIVVEQLIEHADKVFELQEDFFLSFTKDDLLPDHFDGGFSEYQGRDVIQSRHYRSHSQDANITLITEDVKRAQSNSSLSDHSSPPQGSPKPIVRRKNKAPVPPVITVDANKIEDVQSVKENLNGKPIKPPRPIFIDPNKVATGTQTLNRITYKRHSSGNSDIDKSLENLVTDRCLPEQQTLKSNVKEVEDLNEDGKIKLQQLNFKETQIEQTKVTVDNNVQSLTKSQEVMSEKPPVFPKSSSNPALNDNEEIILRRPENNIIGVKPAIPERPPSLRPQSFRNVNTECDNSLQSETETRLRPPRPAIPPPPIPGESTDL